MTSKRTANEYFLARCDAESVTGAEGRAPATLTRFAECTDR